MGVEELPAAFHFGGRRVERGIFRRPQRRVFYFKFELGGRCGVCRNIGFPFRRCDLRAVRSEYRRPHRNFARGAEGILDFSQDASYRGFFAYFRSRYVQSVPGHRHRILYREFHVSENSAAGVPSRPSHDPGVYRHDILSAVVEKFRYVRLVSGVSVFVGGRLLPVYVDVGDRHDAFKVEYHPLSLPFGIRAERLAVPSLSIGFEPPAFEVSAVLFDFLFGRNRPRLLYLVVVRQVELSP